uniref:Uncharacterized protein n=1 Tax=Meloidogyne incognita TaxID=6306 RepID=A0A914MPV9_MELIC
MSNSFYVCLLSNVPDYPDNQPNKFRVHLPKPLYFSGDWVCGVHSISYPYSWSSTIGTLDEQWIKIHFIDENSKKNVIRIPVPAASHINVEALENYLATTLKHQADSIGSLDKTGGFIQPPSVLGSPPRTEKRKRSAEEELRSPSPYSEDDNEDSPPTPDEELRDPSPIEDPPPPIEEPRSPSPYSEDDESPPPKKDKEEDQTQIDVPTSTQKSVLEKEEKNVTQTNTRNEDKNLQKLPPKNIEPQSPPKQNQTQITPPVLTQKENTQKPSPPKNNEPLPKKDKKEEKQTQITPPVLTLKENTQKPSPSKNKEPPPKKDKKEENQTQITSPAILNKETNIDPPSPPRIEVNDTQTTPPPVIANENNTQQPTVLSAVGLEKTREEKKEQNKTQPRSVLAAIGLNSTKKEEKKNASLLSVIGLDRKDNMTQTSPPPSPTVFEAMGLKSNSSRGDKLFQVLFGKESKKAPNPSFVKSIIESLALDYHNDFARFRQLFSHKSIKHVSFSPQLGYVLGFANPQHVQNNEIAKYGCDLRGGFSSFAIYAKGLTENMIVGNSLSSLLRIVSVTGAVPGEYHEKIYDSPIYVRVLPREVNEIEVELRTMDNGRLVPFAYGTVSIVLIFKKVINF